MMDMEEIPDFLKRPKGEKPRELTPVEEKLVQKSLVDSAELIEVLEPPKVNHIHRNMRGAAGELIAEINGRYDDFLIKGEEFNAYEFFRSQEVKPAIVRIVAEKFQPVLGELISSYKDPELKAAYAGINVKESVAFWEGILSDADRWANNLKVGKGLRTTKVKINPEKKIKGLKFQKEDRDLKLISVSPEKIIGAQELWTYNTKYKYLTHYVARGRAGFTVKGTTLQDFDVDNSLTKIVRKPEEVLTKVLEKKKKILESLKTRRIVPTGRINANTILLRVG